MLERKIFDTHAHLDDEIFSENFEQIIKDIKDADVKYVVNPGCDIKTSLKAIELSEKYDFIYCGVGFHPNDTPKASTKDLDTIKFLAEKEKVVAIGEIGLDYHYDGYDKDKQKDFFISQIEIANQLNLPIIIHSRDASEDTYKIIKTCRHLNTPCVLHCFSQSKEMAKKYLDIGCFLSFAGPVTYKNAQKLQEVAKYVPLESMFIETDSPYLTPHPYRGKKNTPAYVALVGEKIAQLKNISVEEVFETTFNNAINFFSIQ